MSGGEERSVPERGVAAAYRARSLQSRAGSVVSFAVASLLGLGLLVWYYSAALKRPARAAENARTTAASRAESEMTLPPLPSIGGGPARDPAGEQATPAAALDGISKGAGSVAPLPLVPLATLPVAPGVHAGAAPAASRPAGAPRRALARRLSGPPFASDSNPGSPSAPSSPPAESPIVGSPAGGGWGSHAAGAAAGAPPDPARVSSADEALAERLVPSTTPAVDAQVLPSETLLLPKGAFIDCTLETAIDSTLPGMTTCITATDTFGADGKVVLLERGSKLVGETRGEVQQGSSRVFVVWSEARTPTGVVIPLASPGTDELGRAGLAGAVNRHFFQRFGAALLISIIDAGAQIAAQSGSGTVVYSPGASQDVMTEVLKDTLRIPPTVVKHQGDRIQVLVARDLDFRSVYELRSAIRQR